MFDSRGAYEAQFSLFHRLILDFGGLFARLPFVASFNRRTVTYPASSESMIKALCAADSCLRSGHGAAVAQVASPSAPTSAITSPSPESMLSVISFGIICVIGS